MIKILSFVAAICASVLAFTLYFVKVPKIENDIKTSGVYLTTVYTDEITSSAGGYSVTQRYYFNIISNKELNDINDVPLGIYVLSPESTYTSGPWSIGYPFIQIRSNGYVIVLSGSSNGYTGGFSFVNEKA